MSIIRAMTTSSVSEGGRAITDTPHGPGRPPEQDPGDKPGTISIVGREVLAQARGATVDITIEIAARDTTEPTPRSHSREAPDKPVIRLRADRRDASAPPLVVCLESGTTRQLAATLLRAADITDDLDHTH
jgi:hypothetical protein